MIIYVLIVIAMALPKLKITAYGINPNYIAKNSTNAIKGFFILLIFASHFCNPISNMLSAPLDAAYWRLRVFLGQMVVAMFLFYSGYGIFMSASEKGHQYINGFVKRRILPILLVYDLSQIIFFAIQTALGKNYSLSDFFLSLIAWKSFGNDNWYIFVIITLYFSALIVMKCFEDKSRRVVALTILCVFLIEFFITAGKGKNWYNTIMCFPLGAAFCVAKPTMDQFLAKGCNYFVAFITILAGFLLSHRFWYVNIAIYELTAMLFALLTVLITMKVDIRSPFLQYCGKHLQGLFLIH